MYVIFFMLCSCNTVAATQMVRFPSGLQDRLCHFFFFYVICDFVRVGIFLNLLKDVFFFFLFLDEVLLVVIVGGCRLQCVLLAFVPFVSFLLFRCWCT